MRTTRSGRRRHALVLAVALLALAGCGGSQSSVSPGDPPVTASSTATASSGMPSDPTDAPAAEGCPYLTADQVSAALGSTVTETAGTVNACFFDPVDTGRGPSVLLSRIDLQINPADYARQSRELCRGDVTDVDAGDVAFACVAGLGPQGQLYVGRVLVNVAVNDAADDAAGIAAAAALLPMVTVPATS
jgi:hypothetical protein